MVNLFNYIKNLTVAYTHATVFHADDVFATALIKLINPSIQIIRTLDTTKSGFYYDIGLGEYDHHQNDAVWRPDGSTKYCAFGLLWRDMGAEVLEALGAKASFTKVDEELVKLIDLADNSSARNPISTAVSQFNPAWDEDGSNDNRDMCFNKAVDFAQEILKVYFNMPCNLFKVTETMKYNSEAFVATNLRAKEAIKAKAEYLHGEEIVVLPQYIPFIGNLPENVTYVIFPALRGGYCLQTISIKTEDGRFVNKAPFPVEYRGMTDKNAIPNPWGMTFCHASGFLANCLTEAGAICAAEWALAEMSKNSKGGDHSLGKNESPNKNKGGKDYGKH